MDVFAELQRLGSLVRQLQGRMKAGGATLASGPLGSITSTSTVAVALTSGPSVTITSPGTYLVRHGLLIQSTAAGLFQGSAKIAKNGAATGATITFIGQTSFDGANVFGEQQLALVAGDVLTLVVIGANAVSTTYSGGTISATL